MSPSAIPPDDILLQVTPALPLPEVWDAIVRPEQLTRWLAPRVRLELREGGPLELFWDPEDHSQN